MLGLDQLNLIVRSSMISTIMVPSRPGSAHSASDGLRPVALPITLKPKALNVLTVTASTPSNPANLALILDWSSSATARLKARTSI